MKEKSSLAIPWKALGLIYVGIILVAAGIVAYVRLSEDASKGTSVQEEVINWSCIATGTCTEEDWHQKKLGECEYYLANNDYREAKKYESLRGYFEECEALVFGPRTPTGVMTPFVE